MANWLAYEQKLFTYGLIFTRQLFSGRKFETDITLEEEPGTDAL